MNVKIDFFYEIYTHAPLKLQWMSRQKNELQCQDRIIQCQDKNLDVKIDTLYEFYIIIVP